MSREKTILDEIAERTLYYVEEKEKQIPLSYMKTEAEKSPMGDFGFEKALRKGNDIAFICEVKKASPSKGIISEDFPYLSIAKDYEAAGADAISCLTEPFWFMGSCGILEEIVQNVSIPVLRKDFTVSRYMIYEAKLLGASAVLLICSILTPEKLKEYIAICDSLGLSALVEAHDGHEIETALKAGARVIGVNNRDLKSFTVDTGNSLGLRGLVPDDVTFVSESGVKTAEDIKRLHDAGVNAVLIGETLMRAADKKQKIAELRSLI